MSHESAPSALNQGYSPGLEPDTGFELISEVMYTSQQLDTELAAFGYETAEQLYDNERGAATLQEKYDLAFDPEAAVRGVGGTALALMIAGPEASQEILTGQTAELLAEQPEQRQPEDTKPDQKGREEKDDTKGPRSKPSIRNPIPSMTTDEIGDAAKELVYITTGIPIDEE